MRLPNLNASEIETLINLTETENFGSLTAKEVNDLLIMAERPLREKYPENNPNSLFLNDEVEVLAMQIVDEYLDAEQIIQRYQDAFLNIDIRNSDINSSQNVKKLELLARTPAFVKVILEYIEN